MSRNQRIATIASGAAVVLLFSCLGIYLSTYLTGAIRATTPQPVQVVETPTVFTSPTPCPTPISVPPTPVPVHLGQHGYTSGEGQHGLNYLLFLPQGYQTEPHEQWPLIVFLHGKGERGDSLEDLEFLKKHGLPMVVEQRPDFPSIVLSPQCPSDSYWELQIDNLNLLLDDIMSTYAVDTNRIYVTGLSTGGFGAWRLALRHPERFAAIVPIAGGYMFESDAIPTNICDLKDVPIWVFHGAQDTVVLPHQSELMVNALQECGSHVRFTLYPDAGHEESWTLAYADPELHEWLLEQTLK